MEKLKPIMEEKKKKLNIKLKQPTYKIVEKYEINDDPPIKEESQIDKEYDIRYDIIEKILSVKCIIIQKNLK